MTHAAWPSGLSAARAGPSFRRLAIRRQRSKARSITATVSAQHTLTTRVCASRNSTLDTRHSTLDTRLIDFAYTFDGVSNIREIRDQRPDSTVATTDKRRNTQTFNYDDLYRLTRVQYNLPAPSPDNGGQINY